MRDPSRSTLARVMTEIGYKLERGALGARPHAVRARSGGTGLRLRGDLGSLRSPGGSAGPEPVCGPDPEAHFARIREYADAGYDHVVVHQIGRDQRGFFRVLRAAGPAEAWIAPQLTADVPALDQAVACSCRTPVYIRWVSGED